MEEINKLYVGMVLVEIKLKFILTGLKLGLAFLGVKLGYKKLEFRIIIGY